MVLDGMLYKKGREHDPPALRIAMRLLVAGAARDLSMCSTTRVSILPKRVSSYVFSTYPVTGNVTAGA